MATYVNNLRLKEIATGDESGTWGNSTNQNLELIGEALGYNTQNCFASDADATTTVADGSTDPARAFYFKVTSSATLSATRTLTIAPNTVSRVMIIENATTGSQSIAISQGSGANVTVPTGEVKMVYLDGAGSGAAVVDAFTNLKVTDAAQTNITSVGTLTSLTVSGDATFDTSTLKVDSSNNRVGIGTASPSTNLHIYSTADNAPHLLLENFQNADTDDAPVIELYLNDQTTGGIGDDTDVGVIRFTGDEKDGGTKETYAEIRGVAHDPGQGASNKGNLSFFVQAAGDLHETLTLDEKNVGIGTATPDVKLELAETASDTGVQLKLNGNRSSNGNVGDIVFENASDSVAMIRANRASANDAADMLFYTQVASGSNAEKMRITSDGLVGIGTTSPSSYNSNARNLVIRDSGNMGITLSSGASSDCFIGFSNGEDTGIHGLIQYDHNSDAMHFRTNDVDSRLMIDSSGKVGIGTASPSEDLHVKGGSGSAFIRIDNSADGHDTGFEIYQNGSRKWEIHSDDSNTDALELRPDGVSGKFLFTQDGKFAVGATSASHLIEAHSGAVASKYDGSHHVAIRGLSGGQYIQYSSANALSFVAVDTYPNSGASTKMTLTTGGELLVGSTSELSPNSRVFINANSNSTNPALNLKAATTTSSGSILIFFAGDNDEVGSVGMSNLEQGTSVSYNTGSDARWKDVTGEARGLEVITKLNPVAFNWKKSGLADEGLIAQEVQEHVPNIVKEGSNGYLQMDYGKLVTPLIKAVQEQQEQIEELKQQINELRGN